MSNRGTGALNRRVLRRNAPVLVAGAVLALAISTPALAQGKSQSHKKNGSGPTPPSRNDLAVPSAASSSGGAAPLAWLDDARILDPGGVSLGSSAVAWE